MTDIIRTPDTAQTVRSDSGGSVQVSTVTQAGASISTQAGTGIPGRDGTSTIQKTALVALGGHRVVIQGATGPEYADSAVPDHQDRVLGMTLGASAAGALSTIARSGEVIEPSWSWQIGPVFLGHNGLLTQTPPSPPDAAFLLTLGFATAPTTLFLAPREPITLH